MTMSWKLTEKGKKLVRDWQVVDNFFTEDTKKSHAWENLINES